jgi:mitochondrial fission protein ELM1
MKPLYVTALIQKGAILKIDTPTNIISNYDKPIYNVRTRNTHQLIQDLKEYLANTVYMPFIISIKCRFQPDEVKTYLENKNHSEIIIKSDNNYRRRFMDL